MEYSFECGACHSIYKLDENQITQKGVKVTCPKCLNYFILKKGFAQSIKLDAAYIEYVVDDGIQPQIPTVKRPLAAAQAPPSSQYSGDDRTEKIITSEATEKIYVGTHQPSAAGRTTRGKQSRVEVAAPYPTLKKPKKYRFLPYLLIFLVIAAVIWILLSDILK